MSEEESFAGALRIVRHDSTVTQFHVVYRDFDLKDRTWWELHWDRKSEWDTYDEALAAVTSCMSASPGTPGKREISEYEIYRVITHAEVVTR